VSSHSGRVRLFKVEEGIHILILTVLLHDSVTATIQHAMEAAPPATDVAMRPRISHMRPGGDSAFNEGDLSDQNPS
jgi:hypothetical protein